MTYPIEPSGQLMRAAHAAAVPAPYPPSSEMWLDVGQEAASFNINKFLHSIRRTWLTAVLTGLVLACTLIALLWFFIPERYEVVGLIQVKSTNKNVFERGTGFVSEQEFDIFKQTQAQLVKSPFVLGRALRDDEIRQSPMLQRRNEAPETFLERELSVTFPARSEILRIALKGKDREETKKIVDAVINAYMAEAEQMERGAVNTRLTMLRSQKLETAKRIREEGEAVKKLADQVGAEDSERVKAQQMVEFAKFQTLASNLAELRKEYNKLQAEYVIAKNSMQMQVFSPNPNMIMDELERDPFYGGYKQEIARLESDLALMQGAVRGGFAAEQRAQKTIEALREKMRQREAELRPRIIARLKLMYGIDDTLQMSKLRDLGVQAQMTQKMIEEVRKEVDDQQQRIKELFGSSAEMLARQTELKTLEEQSMELAKAITADDMNMRAPPRIMLLQPANIPPDSNNWIRWLGLISAGVATFLATVIGFAMVDYSKNIMCSAGDLEKETNIPVLGKLPAMYDGMKSLMGGPSRAKMALVVDSVDSIRAALTRGDKASDIDSVIVTSALGKEGKSTLASQLAVSLARSGKKTVLVDGDLRNPRQHLMFGLPLDRGFWDILRGEASVEEIVQATPSENLWILPAGAPRSGAQPGLSGNEIGKILAHLKAQFDFVVVDTAPVLTGPDAVIFGVHVSGAVMATRQDHSSIEKIDEAQRRLRSVGIRVLGAVINGAAADTRGAQLALPAA